MSDIASAPDIGALEIPMDAWTQPFWDASAQGKLLLPRCSDCRRFRWPPGPFCPHCRSQQTQWLPPGSARLYSYTLVRGPQEEGAEPPPLRVPALVEFPDADGVRILAAITATPLAQIRVGALLSLGWSQAANASVPVFSVLRS
jgi:uncharacterized OB-fold protein